MAQFLYERHSTNVHLNIVKRHIRLARQIKGAEDLVTAIEPLYNELAAKAANTISVTGETEFKRDLLAFADVSLDDKVRDVYEAGKKYDRDHPGIPVTNLLFPDGISPIIYAPAESEPTLVEKLILGIQSLGEHPLAEYIASLQAAVDNSKTAIGELRAAITDEKMAEALESIAKVYLIRHYRVEFIYSASSKFGKAFANRLFPAVNPTSKSGAEKSSDTQ